MERIKILIQTPDGESFLDAVPQSTIDRLQVQRDMLTEIGEDGTYPMIETSSGDYLIVKELTMIE